MALPATDAFTGTDTTALQTYSTNWTINAGGFRILSNTVQPNSSGENAAHWNADAFAADQYAQVVISELATADQTIGPGVRCAASGATYYLYYTASNARYFYVSSAGSLTELGSYGTALSVGNTMRLEANGTTITPLINGAVDANIGAVTNEALSSGYAGLTGYGYSDDCRADSFEGGNLSTTPTFQPRPPAAIDSLMVY